MTRFGWLLRGMGRRKKSSRKTSPASGKGRDIDPPEEKDQKIKRTESSEGELSIRGPCLEGGKKDGPGGRGFSNRSKAEVLLRLSRAKGGGAKLETRRHKNCFWA